MLLVWHLTRSSWRNCWNKWLSCNSRTSASHATVSPPQSPSSPAATTSPASHAPGQPSAVPPAASPSKASSSPTKLEISQPHDVLTPQPREPIGYRFALHSTSSPTLVIRRLIPTTLARWHHEINPCPWENI